jgi:hypothetical protein
MGRERYVLKNPNQGGHDCSMHIAPMDNGILFAVRAHLLNRHTTAWSPSLTSLTTIVCFC